MKRILVVAASLIALGSFGMLGTAEAVIEISDPIFTVVYSPDATFVSGVSTYVNLAPSGSVAIGTVLGEDDSQPVGIYGVGTSLAPLGLQPYYELWFDQSFGTYDSIQYDIFSATITQGDYFWNGGIVIGSYTWGGNTEGGYEGIVDGWHNQATVNVTPGLNYYYNITLQTKEDEALPSWGVFSDVSVGIIPEPSSMLLLGMGLFGLGGAVRKRFKA